MYPPDREQYQAFLNSVWDCTRFFRFYEKGRLIAVAVVDQLEDGLSAIYTFFDPEADKRSLGAYAILWQVEQARTMGLSYLYLGYWIRDCQKMSYKADYRPLQVYIKSRWTELI